MYLEYPGQMILSYSHQLLVYQSQCWKSLSSGTYNYFMIIVHCSARPLISDSPLYGHVGGRRNHDVSKHSIALCQLGKMGNENVDELASKTKPKPKPKQNGVLL